MKKTALALFKTEHQIASALEELEEAGFSRDDMKSFDEIGDTRYGGVRIATIEHEDDRFGDHQSELFRALRYWGVPWYDASLFTEGVRHGGKLAVVFTIEEKMELVIRILRRHGALDLEMRRQFIEEIRQRPTTGEVSSPFTKIVKESRVLHDFADWLHQHRDRVGPRDPVKIYEYSPPEDFGLDRNLNE